MQDVIPLVFLLTQQRDAGCYHPGIFLTQKRDAGCYHPGIFADSEKGCRMLSQAPGIFADSAKDA